VTTTRDAAAAQGAPPTPGAVRAAAAAPTPEAPSPSQALIDSILADLRMGLGELRCVGSERMVRLGVSMTHLHLLSMLDHHGEMPMSRLAELLDVSVSNATGLVDRLEERGLVERVRDREDRRVVIARLADGGREALNELQIGRQDMIQRILGELDADQLERVAMAVRDVRDATLAVLATDPSIAAFWHAHDHRT